MQKHQVKIIRRHWRPVIKALKAQQVHLLQRHLVAYCSKYVFYVANEFEKISVIQSSKYLVVCVLATSNANSFSKTTGAQCLYVASVSQQGQIFLVRLHLNRLHKNSNIWAEPAGMRQEKKWQHSRQVFGYTYCISLDIS